MKTSTKKNLMYILLCTAMLLCALLAAAPAKAMAKPYLLKADDGTSISNALWSHKSVKLESGKTYRLGSPFALRDNMTLDATGATIIANNGICFNNPGKTNYKALKNVTIKGGTWKTSDNRGTTVSVIKIVHASNITFQNMKIRIASFEDHTIELVACKNITIKGCDIAGIGKNNKNSSEEQIQIDVCSPRTAPFVSNGSMYNGAACENIRIINNKITGNRGVCANYSKDSAEKYHKNFHKNIVVKNNTIKGKTAEALVLFNTISCTISGNKLYSYKSDIKVAESVGCHLAIMYKAPSAMKKGKIRITKNTIYGGRQAIHIESHVSGSKYGNVIVTGNKLFCKAGKGNALHINKYRSAYKLTASDNTANVWKK